MDNENRKISNDFSLDGLPFFNYNLEKLGNLGKLFPAMIIINPPEKLSHNIELLLKNGDKLSAKEKYDIQNYFYHLSCQYYLSTLLNKKIIENNTSFFPANLTHVHAFKLRKLPTNYDSRICNLICKKFAEIDRILHLFYQIISFLSVGSNIQEKIASILKNLYGNFFNGYSSNIVNLNLIVGSAKSQDYELKYNLSDKSKWPPSLSVTDYNQNASKFSDSLNSFMQETLGINYNLSNYLKSILCSSIIPSIPNMLFAMIATKEKSLDNLLYRIDNIEIKKSFNSKLSINAIFSVHDKMNESSNNFIKVSSFKLYIEFDLLTLKIIPYFIRPTKLTIEYTSYVPKGKISLPLDFPLNKIIKEDIIKLNNEEKIKFENNPNDIKIEPNSEISKDSNKLENTKTLQENLPFNDAPLRKVISFMIGFSEFINLMNPFSSWFKKKPVEQVLVKEKSNYLQELKSHKLFDKKPFKPMFVYKRKQKK